MICCKKGLKFIYLLCLSFLMLITPIIQNSRANNENFLANEQQKIIEKNKLLTELDYKKNKINENLKKNENSHFLIGLFGIGIPMLIFFSFFFHIVRETCKELLFTHVICDAVPVIYFKKKCQHHETKYINNLIKNNKKFIFFRNENINEFKLTINMPYENIKKTKTINSGFYEYYSNFEKIREFDSYILYNTNNKVFQSIFINFFLNSEETSNSKFKIHFLNVGRGDCTIIQFGTKTIVVDAGSESITDIEKYLKTLGISVIDYFILTHPHFDHFGQMINLFKLLKGTFFHSYLSLELFNSWGFKNKVKNPLDKFSKINGNKNEEITANANPFLTLTDDNNTLKIFAISPQIESKNVNDNSIVLFLELKVENFSEKRILLMADAEKSSEKKIKEFCKKNKINIENVDVYKIGHHGFCTSSGEEFVKLVKPLVAVNSTGKHPMTFWLFNLHESSYVLSIFRKLGTKIFSTERHGNVVFYFDSNGNLDYYFNNGEDFHI